jgi:hypothetical protein
LSLTANPFDEDHKACLDSGKRPAKLYETLLAWLEMRGNCLVTRPMTVLQRLLLRELLYARGRRES